MGVKVEHKSADAAVKGFGTEVADDDPYRFRIIASVTGVRDEVDDIIEPGAYRATLAKRRPKIIKDHDWAKRLGTVPRIVELLPGDPNLPAFTPQGDPWPQGAGALVTDVKLFKTKDGEEARTRWEQEGTQQQYSIGYVVPRGASTKDKDGVRHIKALELLEISDVLWGAMPLAGPMPATLAAKMLTAEDAPTDVEEEVADTAAPGDDTEGVEGEAETSPEQHLDTLLEEDPEADDARFGDMDWAAVDALAETLEDDEQEPDSKSAGHVAVEVKYDTSPVGKPGGRQNWVDKAGGLPSFIRAIAHALIRNGHSEENAIQIAVATVKRWATGAGKVTAKTRAKAAAAVAEWERKKAASHTKAASLDLWGYDPDLEVKDAPMATERKRHRGIDNMPGTFEAFMRAVGEAVRARLTPPADPTDAKDPKAEPSECYVSIEGTYSDHVVATVARYHSGAGSDITSYSLPYTYDDTKGVLLGEPQEVRLVVTVVPDEPAQDVTLADVVPLPEMVDDVALAVKAYLHAATEEKAGRVLSSANAARLKAAVESLVAIARAAGVDIQVTPQAAPASAATAAAVPVPEAKALPDPMEMARQLRAFAESV